MRKVLLILAFLAGALDVSAQFDFRSTGTQTMTNLAINLSTQPAVAPTGKIVCYGDSSTLTIKCSVNGGPYADIGAGVGGSGVSSVFGRSGAVVANAGDYLASQVTATPHGTIAGTNVQTQLQQIDARISSAAISSVFGRTGAVVATAGDYLASQVTNVPAGSIAAATVQAAVDELASEKADRTVATTVTAPWTFNYAGAALLIKPASAPSANTKLLELRTTADAPLFSADYEGDVFAAGSATVSGNLGVGTSPAAPFHVFTSGTSTNLAGNIAATIRSGAVGRDATLHFSDTSNSATVSLLGATMRAAVGGVERLKLDSTGIAATETLGTELVTLDGSFGSGTGWSFASAKWTHSTGTTPLTSVWTPTAGVTYKLTISTADFTQGGLSIKLGGESVGTITDNVTSKIYYVTAATTGAILFTPVVDTSGLVYNGSITALSVKALSSGGATASPVLTASQINLGTGGFTFDDAKHEYAFGYRAGFGATGTYANYYGHSAGTANAGIQSNFFGLNAGTSNTGDHSNGNGSHSLQNNTGTHSNAHGLYSLYGNTGSYSNAFGDQAGLSNTGSGSNMFGRDAGANNTGSVLAAFGNQAAKDNTGVAVVAMGDGAANGNGGDSVVAIGGGTPLAGNQGDGMIAMGFRAGYGATSTNRPINDTNGILIGYEANRSVASGTVLTNYIGIGAGTLIDQSNQVKIGNVNITRTDLFGTLVLSGKLNIAGTAATNTQQTFTGTTTGYNVFRLTNTGGDLFAGVEASAGGTVWTGTTAYAGLFGTVSNTPLHFATNNTRQATLATDGSLTLNNSTSGCVKSFGRSTCDNVWTTFTPATSANTGTFDTCTATTARYSLAGKTMKLTVVLSNCAVTGTPNNLRVTIPDSRVSAVQTEDTFSYSDAGTPGTGTLQTSAGGTTIFLFKNINGSVGWTAGTTKVSFEAEIEIQ
jgi:hypothetical protein